MNSIGTQLKSVRKERGWSLEYVSHHSRIHARILNCLETDDYSVFGSPTLAKSFIKKYGSFLGMDVRHQVDALKIEGYSSTRTGVAKSQIKESLETSDVSLATPRYRKAADRNGTPIFLSGSLVALVTLLGGFYYLGSKADLRNTGLPVAGQPEVPAKVVTEIQTAGQTDIVKSASKKGDSPVQSPIPVGLKPE